MKLSTRLTLAMVALVGLTAAAVGVLTYRNIESAVTPRALDRLELEARLLADNLAADVRGARSEVLGFRAAVALDGIMRASLAGGVDPVDQTTLDEWRRRMAGRYSVELAANPLFTQFRILGTDGREIVRVDRSGANGAVRIVPDAELQPKGRRDYFQRMIEMRSGEVYVSPVELNQEHDKIEVPHVPVLRVGTPVYGPNGRPFGVVIINVDMRPAFDRIRQAARPPARVFVVNDRGDFLVHPDRGREFGFELGRPSTVKDEFPTLTDKLADGAPRPAIVDDNDGTRYAAGLATVTLAGGPRVTVIDAVPYADILESFDAVRDASVLGGLAAVLLAVALAVVLGRSLVQPLARMTEAVEGFGRGETLPVPEQASGEIGTLARAFTRMSQDVTEKTATIRRNAEIFDNIMSGMTSGVLLVDENMNNVYANPAARTILGPLVNTDWRGWQAAQQLFHPDGVTLLAPDERPRVRAMRGESVDNLEMALRLEGRDDLVQIIVSSRPLRDEDGKVTGAVMVFNDVTKFRETERQLRQSQKLDAIGQLTGGVAHDFNNLLTVIIGSAEVLAETLGDRPDVAGQIKAIDDAATRGSDLTRQLLAFARRQALEPRLTDVNALIADAARLLKPTLGEHVELEAALAGDAWPAMIDPAQLTTALVNLAVNARDAMPDGGKLTIETDNIVLDDSYAAANAEVQPGEYVMIAVSDTGTGIPAAIREKVFEPFFTTKEVGKGTGLGLSMVYGFIKQSRGHIKIYSEEGLGTTIRLYLPRATRDGEAAAEPVASTTLPVGNETVLVVEDDDLVREHVVAQLESLGYRTLSAPNGAAALALVDEGVKFDLLFTDVIMPGGMSGRQLADELRRRWPALKVLYTSGYAENAVVHHGRLDAGVSLLNKPYRKADLARKVREVLSAPPRVH